MEILNSCTDCDEIQFKEDGCWSPMRWKKEVQEVSSASYSNGVDGESLTLVGTVGSGSIFGLIRLHEEPEDEVLE